MKEGARWKCSSCKKTAGKWSRLASAKCGGLAAEMWARRAKALGEAGGTDGAGHLRAARGSMTWCTRCGAYAVAWAVGLAAPCSGAPANQSQQRVRNRLARGRHPRTNEPLDGELVMEVAERAGARGEGSDPADTRGRVEGSRAADGGMLRQAGKRKREQGFAGGEVPRSTAGYLRRPGGARAAFEAVFRPGGSNPGDSGEGAAEQPAGHAALQSTEAKMAEAIEAGARAAKEMPQVANRDGSLRLESGGRGGNESQTPEVPTNRRRLLEDLKEKVEEAKKRRKAEAA